MHARVAAIECTGCTDQRRGVRWGIAVPVSRVERDEAGDGGRDGGGGGTEVRAGWRTKARGSGVDIGHGGQSEMG